MVSDKNDEIVTMAVNKAEAPIFDFPFLELNFAAWPL